jgi:hypothetical protein
VREYVITALSLTALVRGTTTAALHHPQPEAVAGPDSGWSITETGAAPGWSVTAAHERMW